MPRLVAIPPTAGAVRESRESYGRFNGNDRLRDRVPTGRAARLQREDGLVMGKSTRVTVNIDGYGKRVIVATWQGGPYVDLHWDWAQSPAFEVLNVWDYETGACEIPFTREALRGKLLGFVHDPETDLANYFDHTHPAGRWS